MNRRDAVLALLALGSVIHPLLLAAQVRSDGRPFRIGFTSNISPAVRQMFIDLMTGFGWTYGRDYTFVESGLPFGPEIEEAARRIVAEKPDVIFVITTAYAVAVQRLTATTPIVMYASGYPVAAGVAHSLARPGKNVTGNTTYAGTGIWGKLFQLLRECKPSVRRIGLLWDYLPPIFPREEVDFGMGDLRNDARLLGLDIYFAEVRHPEEVTAALAGLASWRAEALLVTSGPQLFSERPRVMQTAIERRLPTITDAHWNPPPEPSPLLAYAPAAPELRRQAFAYIDRILRGANPGDLPIQQPVKFELAINLRTAKALGLTIPKELLLRADRLVE